MTKLRYFHFLFVLFLLSAPAFAAISAADNSTMSPITVDRTQITNAQSKDADSDDTAAQKLQKASDEFQKQVKTLTELIGTLETKVTDLRKQAVPPLDADIQQVNKDLSLLDQQIVDLATLDSSPLAQLQRSDLQDRLFQIRMAMELLDRRWNTGETVFGLSFFSNSSPAMVPESQPVPETYRIRVGDKLRVLFVSSLGAQNEYLPKVESDGKVALRGLGRVSASGKTVQQFSDLVNSKVRSKFKQLRAEVDVEKLAAIQVQVAGEVERPGTYVMNGFATVFSALVQAGGPKKTGTFRNISLVRGRGGKRVIDLYDFLLNGSKKQDLPLENGDMIFVPPIGKTVLVSGEIVRPGRYEPSFPISLAKMLKMAGGAKSSGYLQTVQVDRVVDGQYVVLINEPVSQANSKSGFDVQPGDEISVLSIRPDKTNQVSIEGPVIAPGVYGLTDDMRVSTLVKLARGLASDKEVYRGRGDILRIDPEKGSEIISFDLDKALKGDSNDDVPLRKLDQVFLYEPDQVVFRPRLITLTGAVSRPGTYKRREGMRVNDAIAAAGGVVPQAYLKRADLLRQLDNGSTQLIRIDLQAALNGDPNANCKLSDRDEISIYTNDDVRWKDHTVRIEGAVQRPGVYVCSEGMRVTDLMFMCGGCLPEAAGVEVARSDADGKSNVTTLDLVKLKAQSDNDVLLCDGDVVTVPAVSSYLRSPAVVYITGEVAKPGPYALNSRSERLTELISRAGGVTEYADVNGALFLRQKDEFENAQQQQDVDLVLTRSRAFADKQFLVQLAKMGVTLPSTFTASGDKVMEATSKPAEVVEDKDLEVVGETGESSDTAKEGKSLPGGGELSRISTSAEKNSGSDRAGNPVQTGKSGDIDQIDQSDQAPAVSAMGLPVETDSQSTKYEGMNKLADVSDSARITVNLSRALQDTSTPDNLILHNGDRVYIPRASNIVTVIGAVLHPHSFAAGPNKNVDYYIDRSGGYSQDASRPHVIVVHANGEALPKNSIKTVVPGDTIIVPNTGLIDITKKWERTGSVTKVISDILSSVFVLTKF